MGPVLQEHWVGVRGFPEYEVSNTGKIYNKTKDKELKPTRCKNGLKRINLRIDGQQKAFYVHRLVAQHFLPGFDHDVEVNFVGPDQNDCSVANLEVSKRRRRGPRRLDEC